jgi:hypothetical protein
MTLIPFFLSLQNQLRVYHWQTKSYPQHMAFGGIYEALDPLIDKFIEVSIGKNGDNDTEVDFSLKLFNYGKNYGEIIDVYLEMLSADITPLFDSQRDSELLNIKDEIVAELQKLKYLLTLN